MNSPYFFMSLSFGFFLFFFYKKIWPLCLASITQYQHQIQSEMIMREDKITLLSDTINQLTEDLQGLEQTIYQMLKEAKQQAEVLKKHHARFLEQEIRDRQERSEHILHTFQKKVQRAYLEQALVYSLKTAEEVCRDSYHKAEYIDYHTQNAIQHI